LTEILSHTWEGTTVRILSEGHREDWGPSYVSCSIQIETPEGKITVHGKQWAMIRPMVRSLYSQATQFGVDRAIMDNF
jgi:hypothetical protein